MYVQGCKLLKDQKYAPTYVGAVERSKVRSGTTVEVVVRDGICLGTDGASDGIDVDNYDEIDVDDTVDETIRIT